MIRTTPFRRGKWKNAYTQTPPVTMAERLGLKLAEQTLLLASESPLIRELMLQLQAVGLLNAAY